MMCPLGDVVMSVPARVTARVVLRALEATTFRVQASLWLLCLSVMGTGISAGAFAQAAPEAAAAGPLAEIIVTARKVEENLQDIPMSIQVLSGDYLDDADLTHVYQLQFSVPGLVVNKLGLNGAGFSLRGVADQGGTSQSVAGHLNGVYLGVSDLSIVRLFDLERIEVLKGPQGTLYGRNASGGSINFITRVPEDEPDANIEAAYGSFDTARLQGYVNMPSDQLDFRLAFIGSEGDGYIRNSVDDRRFAEEDFWGLRGSLRAELTDNLRLDLMAQRVVDDGASGDLWTPALPFLIDPDDIRLTTVTLANPFLVTENDNLSVNIQYDLGFASLHSVTGYARNELRDLDDCAGIPELQGCIRGVRPAKYHQWSQEFRLASHGAAVDWLVGTYVFAADGSSRFHFSRPLLSPLPINNSVSTSDETAYAVFGQATWHLDSRWSVTGGVRLSAEEHRVSRIGTGLADHQTLTSAENDSDHDSWRFDLEYAATDSVLAYAGVSKGFKSGGITTTILPSGDFNEFDPEDVVAYEAGFKAQRPDQRLTLNAAAFFYDFRDLQITSVYLLDNEAIAEIENAGKAEIHGIDAEGTFRISDRLTASGGVVWLPKRKVIEFESERREESLAGNTLSRAPEWSATTALDYEQPLGDRGSLSGRLEYSYRSDHFFTIENTPTHAQDDFGLLNLLLKFEAPDGKWYVFAAGRNLTDEDYFNQVFLQSSPGYPDTYEVGVGLHF